ncbi:hypothetical protein ACSCB1_44315 [Streptomyces europaeiscabiei]|uniref:hypothetical protein n=1 Tax=Streptomyces europaeiscabiei TaxID=146819 RepID=UPI00069BD5AD|nr:hypothetical protein [Streptomyces europaeiscabiei]
MEGFFDGLEQAVRAENWHAALVMSLTLPDICAKVVTPTGSSGRRYAAWFDEHLKPRYTSGVGPRREPLVFLSGDDCYALRCTLLHEGSADITQQRARQVLELFRFYVPGKRNIRAHRNRCNDTLILMVDEFATDVLDTARAWWASLTDEEREATRQRQLTLSDSDAMLGI